MFTLRKYQEEAVEKGLSFFNDSKKKGGAILVLPTGSGKSLVIASIANQLEGNTIVLQPSKEILEQNYQKMSFFGFGSIGIFSASVGRKDIGKITFATIGSVIKKKELFEQFQHVIVDECHLVNAKGGMYEEFINHLGGKVLGLTATPYRLHSFNDMKTGEPSVVAKFLTRTRPRMFQEIPHITQLSELFEEGYLCPIEYIVYSEYQTEDLRLNSTGMDFTEESIRRANENSRIVKFIQDEVEKKKSKHILVFNAFVDEAEVLKRNLEHSGIIAETLSADTDKKTRERILRDFKNGEIEVVTNVGVLTTGFDFPELDCVVLARPTQSVALYYQMVGRGVRVHENKKILRVIDVCGNFEKFGSLSDFEIVEPRPKMHRLKSDKKFLTGYCFVQNEDLEARGPGVGKNSGEITFGKYKGKNLKEVPVGYLEWCIENLQSKDWVEKMKEEVKRRN